MQIEEIFISSFSHTLTCEFATKPFIVPFSAKKSTERLVYGLFINAKLSYASVKMVTGPILLLWL